MQIYGDVLTVGCKVVAIFVNGVHLSHKITRDPRKTRNVYVSKAKTNPTISRDGKISITTLWIIYSFRVMICLNLLPIYPNLSLKTLSYNFVLDFQNL